MASSPKARGLRSCGRCLRAAPRPTGRRAALAPRRRSVRPSSVLMWRRASAPHQPRNWTQPVCGSAWTSRTGLADGDASARGQVGLGDVEVDVELVTALGPGLGLRVAADELGEPRVHDRDLRVGAGCRRECMPGPVHPVVADEAVLGVELALRQDLALAASQGAAPPGAPHPRPWAPRARRPCLPGAALPSGMSCPEYAARLVVRSSQMPALIRLP